LLISVWNSYSWLLFVLFSSPHSPHASIFFLMELDRTRSVLKIQLLGSYHFVIPILSKFCDFLLLVWSSYDQSLQVKIRCESFIWWLFPDVWRNSNRWRVQWSSQAATNE
jgi:hypothetical protein